MSRVASLRSRQRAERQDRDGSLADHVLRELRVRQLWRSGTGSCEPLDSCGGGLGLFDLHTGRSQEAEFGQKHLQAP